MQMFKAVAVGEEGDQVSENLFSPTWENLFAKVSKKELLKRILFIRKSARCSVENLLCLCFHRYNFLDYIKIDRCLINLSHIQLQVYLILMANIPKHQSVPKEGNKILDKPWLAIGIHLVILWPCQYEHYFFFHCFFWNLSSITSTVHVWAIQCIELSQDCLLSSEYCATDYMPPLILIDISNSSHLFSYRQVIQL